MIGTAMLLAVGWRPMFLALGLVSLLWLTPWFVVTAKLPRSFGQRSGGRRVVCSLDASDPSGARQ
jgi:hypothetical protein